MEFGSACYWSGMVVCTGRAMLECATVAALIKYDYDMLTVSEKAAAHIITCIIHRYSTDPLYSLTA
jgi:hypothetical protein